MAATILIVDDEPVQRRLLEANITRFGYKTLTTDSGEAALELLTSDKGARVSGMVLDLVMPGMDGIELLETLDRKGKHFPTIVQTAQGGVETAVRAMRAGAIDFVVKPASPERLRVSLDNALKLEVLTGELKRVTRKAEGKLTVDEIISASPLMDRVKAIVKKAAISNIPVLIEGESGVGKEMIARAIQGMSERATKAFITVNCGALPENLVESALFGHEKGAFTGASAKHKGKFLEADGGTLFLDEVGELTLDMQVKLLRAIQEGEIEPVGANKPIKVDLRLISATNRDLETEVHAGRFREDLYYRLNVLPLTVPPLRERSEDVPELTRHFLTRFAAEEGRQQLRGVARDAEAMLNAYDWPGNIRQLENAVFRAVVLSENEELTADDFPQIAADSDPAFVPQHLVPSIETPLGEGISAESRLNMLDGEGEILPLDQVEAETIRFALQRYGGRMSTVARRLGIGRSTLYRKLKEYGLDTTESMR